MSNEQTPNNRQKSRHRAAGIALLAALALTAAACGDAAGSVETTTVEIGVGADDTSEDASEDASEDREAELGDGLPSLGEDEDINPAADDSDSVVDGEPSPNEQAAIEEFIACMEDEGIDSSIMDSGTDAEQQALATSPEFVAAEQVCGYILADAFGSFDLDPEMEAALADRSAEMAACGREVLGIEIPDNILLLDDDDPMWAEIDNLDTTPEQDAAIEQCLEDILGDIIDEEGNLIAPEEEE